MAFLLTDTPMDSSSFALRLKNDVGLITGRRIGYGYLSELTGRIHIYQYRNKEDRIQEACEVMI